MKHLPRQDRFTPKINFSIHDVFLDLKKSLSRKVFSIIKKVLRGTRIKEDENDLFKKNTHRKTSFIWQGFQTQPVDGA